MTTLVSLAPAVFVEAAAAEPEDKYA